jgi:hypothetical protein
VAGIGLITTDPAYEKQGLATQLLEHCEEDAMAAGCALAVLWSHRFEFYSKRGYLPTGFEYQWKIPKEKISQLKTNVKIEKITQFSEIHFIYEKSKLGPRREISRYENFTHLPGTFAHRSDKTYAFMGKARDLHNTIHEINGDTSHTLELIQSFSTLCDANEVSILLPCSSPHAQIIKNTFGEGTRGAFALMKILKGDSLVEKFIRSSKYPSHIDFKIQPHSFQILDNQKIIFDSEDWVHFQQLFMGPLYPEEFEDLAAPLKDTLRKIQVPPIYFWGFDSV